MGKISDLDMLLIKSYKKIPKNAKNSIRYNRLLMGFQSIYRNIKIFSKKGILLYHIIELINY